MLRGIVMNQQTTAGKKKDTSLTINLLKHQEHIMNLMIRRRHERIRRLTQFRKRKP
jgi:hypothetical protein